MKAVREVESVVAHEMAPNDVPRDRQIVEGIICEHSEGACTPEPRQIDQRRKREGKEREETDTLCSSKGGLRADGGVLDHGTRGSDSNVVSARRHGGYDQ